MIAKLRGIVDQLGEEGVILDVGGVGYLLTCSSRTMAALPAPGLAASLLVETHMREDGIFLYGFGDPGEKHWFRLLTTVQGVGAKVALAILSVHSPEALLHAIAAQDKAALTRASGVGQKLALRILTELKDKAGSIALGGLPRGMEDGLAGVAGEAVSALVNLGYRRGEAASAVAGASRQLGPQAGIEQLIRAGLKELAPHG